jgi:uncharacterized protein (TIGR00369 family)
LEISGLLDRGSTNGVPILTRIFRVSKVKVLKDRDGKATKRVTTSLITIEEFANLAMGEPWFGTWLAPELEDIGYGTSRISLNIRQDFLREGDSVAGPVIMAVADIAMYAAMMSRYEHGKFAVTSDMTMHFLRRPTGKVIHATATIIKPGRRLAMIRTEVFAENGEDPVCHVVGTYAVPDKAP